MVPADDEHTSPNSTEKSTSTRNSPEKSEFCKHRTEDNDEPRPLQPLPPCLMKWKAPVWIAVAGFFIALPFAIIWRGTPHWPSAEAMKLCATIAGAGFAFSAWQQRSHDNATNAKQARATIERDDYWKRREHIFQLLGSENSRLRLAAIEMLTELADTTKHSSILTDEEKRHLQIHIVNTLCLQLRHEGTIENSEINDAEHAEVQRTIINAILTRIKRNQESNTYADWSGIQINLNGARVLPEVNINNIHTSARINISDAHFLEKVTITNSSLGPVQWEQTTFEKGLTIGSADKPVSLYATTMPPYTTETYLTNATFFTSGTKVSTQINKQTIDRELTKLTIDNCRFYTSKCRCDLFCKCRTIPPSTDICTCKARGVCKCESECINATVEILSKQTTNETLKEVQANRHIKISRSTFYSIVIHLNETYSTLTLDSNTITNTLILKLEDNGDGNDTHRSSTKTSTASFSNNNFIIAANILPIKIELSYSHTTEAELQFSNNYLLPKLINSPSIATLNTRTAMRKRLIFQILDSEDERFHFSVEKPWGIPELRDSWSTGHGSKINHTNTQG